MRRGGGPTGIWSGNLVILVVNFENINSMNWIHILDKYESIGIFRI